MLFNVNSYIKVRLTEAGKQLLREDVDTYLRGHFPEAKEYGFYNVNGDILTIQAWRYMEVFGPHLQSKAPAETVIFIDNEYLFEGEL